MPFTAKMIVEYGIRLITWGFILYGSEYKGKLVIDCRVAKELTTISKTIGLNEPFTLVRLNHKCHPVVDTANYPVQPIS